MPLFILLHQHDSERCPAKDPYRGSALLNHLSPASVHQQGVQIHAEAVVEGKHSLYLIVDAPDERRVRDFIKPFEACGTVNVYPASSCAKVVASGGCGAAAPRVDLLGPAADPEKACEEAIRTGLVVHRCHPLNGEASIPALIGGAVMPSLSMAAVGARPGGAPPTAESARPAKSAFSIAGGYARMRRERSLAARSAGRWGAVAVGRGQYRGVDRRSVD